MIQNYVRIGLVPPPVDKRYYTKNHLILLALVDQLKEIYSLEDIKKVFAPILKDTTTFEDDVIDISNIYENYISLHKQALIEWQKCLPNTLNHVNLQVETNHTTEKDKNLASSFLLVLTLMAQSIATKQLIEIISNQYLKNE
jgi:DNA-binding transcriptional MerR regulator